MIYHHWGLRISLQSHDNAKLVQILPKVVVKLSWETGGEQMRDTGVKASSLSKRKYIEVISRAVKLR